ncbi:MAG: hypothetical protein ACI4JF_01280 [Oscillospiraceae bacterium]
MNMKKPSELKKLAFEKLTDCWCECIALFLVELGSLAVCILSFLLIVQFLYSRGTIGHGVDSIFVKGGIGVYAAFAGMLILFSILGAPLKYGKKWFFIQTIRGNSVPASCFFTCYMHKEHYGRIFLLEAKITLRKLAALAPAAAVGCVIVYIAGRLYKSSGGSGSYTIIMVLLTLIFSGMLFLYLYFSRRYFLASYIYAINPKKSTDRIIKESCEAVSGYQGYLNEILASFSGWILACVAVFPAMYVIPYLMMTFSLAANDLIKNYTEVQRRIGEDTAKKEEGALV